MLCPNVLHTLCAIWCGKSLGNVLSSLQSSSSAKKKVHLAEWRTKSIGIHNVTSVPVFCISFLFDHSNNFVFCSIELQFNWVLEQFWMNENLYSITWVFFLRWDPLKSRKCFSTTFSSFWKLFKPFFPCTPLIFPTKTKIAWVISCFSFLYRERGEFLDLKRCQYLTSEDFCSLTAQQIEAIIDTPIPETW